MKNRAILFALVLMSASILAQNPKPSIDQVEPHVVETSYDKFKDRTTLQLNPMVIKGGNTKLADLKLMMGWSADVLLLTGTIIYPGTRPVKPEVVALGFVAVSTDKHFQRDKELIFLADGERIKVGQALTTENSTLQGQNCEMAFYALPLETTWKISMAQKVEGKVGPIEFELQENHLGALRDLLSRVPR